MAAERPMGFNNNRGAQSNMRPQQGSFNNNRGNAQSGMRPQQCARSTITAATRSNRGNRSIGRSFTQPRNCNSSNRGSRSISSASRQPQYQQESRQPQYQQQARSRSIGSFAMSRVLHRQHEQSRPQPQREDKAAEGAQGTLIPAWL